VAYLYNFSGQPWKTQEKVHEIMDLLYHTGPGGIPGNEDMGSLSSWYVLSAMGIYPVTPGQDIYVIGSPVFEKITLRLSSPYKGKEFTIIANQVSKENKYIQSATLNGEPFNRTWIRHQKIVNGGSLVFEMGNEPNQKWGSDTSAIPPSMTR
jgi:predicted alpha-1,2-mannosidase